MKSKFLSLVLTLAICVTVGVVFVGCDNADAGTRHKVVFMSENYGSTTSNVVETVYTDGNETLTIPEAQELAGYDFVRYVYYVAQEGSDVPVAMDFTADTLKNTALTSDIVVYPYYSAKFYNIRYIIDGAEWDAHDTSNALIPEYQISENDIALPTMTKAGFTFDGWYFTADYNVKMTSIAANSTGDLVLYARFL